MRQIGKIPEKHVGYKVKGNRVFIIVKLSNKILHEASMNPISTTFRMLSNVIKYQIYPNIKTKFAPQWLKKNFENNTYPVSGIELEYVICV